MNIRKRPAAVERSGTVNPEMVREVATSLFAERGYNGTSMKDLASALGIQAPSIYNHMESKGALLREILFDVFDVLEDSVLPKLAEDAPAPVRLLHATEAHVWHHATYRMETHIAESDLLALEPEAREIYVAKRRGYARLWQQLVQAGVDTGVFETRSPSLAARAIIELGISVANWFHADGSLSKAEVAREYALIALQIVRCKPEIIERLDSSEQ